MMENTQPKVLFWKGRRIANMTKEELQEALISCATRIEELTMRNADYLAAMDAGKYLNQRGSTKS